ncbi:MAG: hypothetical protein A2V84_06170 [Chloroflexi bacterium RBG_16_70_13]|nr:MAG: hypothetical protein A2V84_06170 [Chloroflexi bacterium RBG_16_70_13]
MAGASVSHSSRNRAWPSDSRPIANHAARAVRPRAARLPKTHAQPTPSRRPIRRAIEAMPDSPARTTRIMTAIPVLWMRPSGMNSKIASDSPLSGPWAEYMNSAKNAARRTAKRVATAGRVYIVRATRVRS